MLLSQPRDMHVATSASGILLRVSCRSSISQGGHHCSLPWRQSSRLYIPLPTPKVTATGAHHQDDCTLLCYAVVLDRYNRLFDVVACGHPSHGMHQGAMPLRRGASMSRFMSRLRLQSVTVVHVSNAASFSKQPCPRHRQRQIVASHLTKP